MSDDEETMMNGGSAALDEKDQKPHSATSDDDDSSSSSSGSSSSSDSSDSESDGEDNGKGEGGGDDGARQSQHPDDRDRKYSIESVASSNGLRGNGTGNGSGAAEPLNVNPNRAAARFREQNSEVGLMALGTKKRDRRTIEEIQRDLQKKRGRSSLLSSSSNGSRPPTGSGSSSSAFAARASPPKGSPVLSPEQPGSDSSQLALGLPQMKIPKGKPNSARSRLNQKLFGRGNSKPAPAAKSAATKKQIGLATSSSSSGAGGMVTNISAGAKASKPASSPNDLDSYVAEQRVDHQSQASSRQLEPRIEARVVDWKPDTKVVRALLRAMLRFGDLTDVNLFASSRESFADEHKLPNFVLRSNLPASTKVPEDKLLKTAAEIADRAQKSIEDKQDSMKFADVEVKSSQIIERLYENLKLRVAVQRALRDARYKKSDDKGAYVLVAKQSDLPTLGISRDGILPWSWAEKEHDWNSRKDTALLLGIYVHGFGAWEDILNDDLLHFNSQRALKGERMKKRAENLLKRLPSPDESGDPRVVQLANALIAAAQNPNQSLGAQFSAIINKDSNSSSNNNNSILPNKGRLHRAAERAAARGSGGSESTRQAVVPDDSIRRSNTLTGNSSSSSERHRKPSVTSPAMTPTPAAIASTSGYKDNEPEDGEIGAKPTTSSSSSLKRSSSPKRPVSSSSTVSIERGAPAPVSNGSPRKKSTKRSSSDRSSSSRKEKKKQQRRLLSEEESFEKWKPSKRLKDIRQVLKKMKIMETWSKNQKDEVVVEKVFKYVTTIGGAIDEIVQRVEKKEGGAEKVDAHEWDELCSSLWAYAAEYTPFSSVRFERLYDDICADGDSLREKNNGVNADKGRRSSAST
ncbi:hypothetical protein Gpo141_00006602 [Globisporangium polare]